MESIVPVLVGALAATSAAAACGGTGSGKASRAVSMREAVQGLLEAAAGLLPAWAVDAAARGGTARAWAEVLPLGRLRITVESDAERAALLVLSGAVMALALGVVSTSPLGVLLGAAVPAVVGAARAYADRRRAAHDIEEAMPEAFAALSMSLGSGHSLAQGMRFVGTHAGEPVRTEFTRVAAAIGCGVPAADALDDLLERVDAPGLGLVALALKVSQRTGAPLAELLSEASSMVGDRIELKRRLDVKTSQARMSAHMVAAMPVAMVAVLSLLSADFRRGLATPVGAASVTLALALNAVALAVIRRIMRVRL